MHVYIAGVLGLSSDDDVVKTVVKNAEDYANKYNIADWDYNFKYYVSKVRNAKNFHA